METSFEKSELYKKALKEYQDKIYWEILKPLHVIIINEDEVYLFYNQNIVQDIYIKLKDIYNKQHEDEITDFPISLWYDYPELRDITFMGNKYKVIYLWYDNCEVPKYFKAKL
mgnify:CR=1 FL=1